MSLQYNFSLLARYNQWMNNQLYQLASTLTHDELLQNRGAFFGSVAGKSLTGGRFNLVKQI